MHLTEEATRNQIRKWVDVLKYRFHYYASNVRPTDQESTAIENTVCHSQFPGEGGTPGHAGPSVGSREEGIKMPGVFIVVCTGK